MTQRGSRARTARIVAVGQTPPPFGGQALMLHYLVSHEFSDFEIEHVRMLFSRSISEQRKLTVRKLAVMLDLIRRTILTRLRGPAVLYFPPAGDSLLPLIRDAVFLAAVRPFFARTVWHFEAAGLADTLSSAPAPLRWFVRFALGKPDAAIVLSDKTRQDADVLHPKAVFVVPNAALTPPSEGTHERSPIQATPLIMFAGVLRESKGILDLIRAVRVCAERGFRFRVELAGDFADAGEKLRFERLVVEARLPDTVCVLGSLDRDEMVAAFRRADIFCFPSFFDCENQPVSIIEAMSHGLPVVASSWRAIPDLVADGSSGYLVPPHDVAALADRLMRLHSDHELRGAMGREAHQMYLERFTLDAHLRMMEDALGAVARG